ncbi:hypothetical protein LINPERHAP2_LOCUS16335 [Linum perenne]
MGVRVTILFLMLQQRA